MHQEEQYLNIINQILYTGTDNVDRTGIGTRKIFGTQMRFDLSKYFPALTTKKLAWKSIVSELLWFIEGTGDERRLAEILHGTRDEDKKTIWTANANADYWKDKAKFSGDVGRVYGVQWRHWKKTKVASWNDLNETPDRKLYTGAKVIETEIDQLKELIDGIKKDPYSRRHILSAWNVGELDEMALPPCHTLCQFFVSNNKLSCHLFQRSADFFLGVPFNIASYALFTHMIAQVCDLEVGEFLHSITDVHLYHNHFEQAKEQVSRIPFELPQLKLNPNIKNIDDFTMDDIELVGYTSHSAIKADMAV